MNIVARAKAPTPKFFKVLRTVGLSLLAISGSIVAAPVALPAIVVTIAGYAAVAGSVISAVSQITVDDGILRKAQKDKNFDEILRQAQDDGGQAQDDDVLRQAQDDEALRQAQDDNGQAQDDNDTTGHGTE